MMAIPLRVPFSTSLTHDSPILDLSIKNESRIPRNSFVCKAAPMIQDPDPGSMVSPQNQDSRFHYIPSPMIRSAYLNCQSSLENPGSYITYQPSFPNLTAYVNYQPLLLNQETANNYQPSQVNQNIFTPKVPETTGITKMEPDLNSDVAECRGKVDTSSESSNKSQQSSTEHETNSNVTKSLAPRPFKIVAKGHVPLVSKNFDILAEDSDDDYEEYKNKVLSQYPNHCNVTNKNMRRYYANTQKYDDPSYLEKRKKNNEAAKRSRDLRKAKEDDMAIRWMYLEKQNIKLQYRIAFLEKEKERLHKVVYQRVQ